MTDSQKIAAAQARMERIFAKKPEMAKGPGVTKATLKEGLVCEAVDGGWRMTFDQPATMGGDDSGPNPGFAGRAAVAACLVQGYAIGFARAGIEVESLEVEVTGLSDDRGFLGMDGVPPGYEQMIFRVAVKADAPPERIEEILSGVEKCSPWLYNMTQALPVKRELTLL